MNVKTYTQSDYSGGLNDTASAREIKRNQASILRNWDITEKGKLTRRDGLVRLGQTISASPITGLGLFARDAGSDLLCIEDTSLHFLNGSVWSELDSGFTNTSGLLFWMESVQQLGRIYIGNEDNTTHYWDRAATTLNSCLTDLGAAVPHGNVYRWHKNHMFTMNNANVSGTKYPHRLYWSALGDPSTWDTTSDFFEIPGDGKAMTMIDVGNNLILFKERAIQYLSGWGDTDWRLTATASNVANLSAQIGIAGPRAVTSVDGEAWFIDDEGQIRRIKKTDFDTVAVPELICKNIQGTLSGVNKAQLSKCVAWTNKNKVYFAYPNGSDTTNSLICVFDLIASGRTGEEAWTTYTGWYPNVFADYIASGIPNLVMGDATEAKVYNHTGEDDNGTAIDANWTGKDDSFDHDDQYKRYRFGNIRAEAVSGDITVDVYASVDFSPFADLGDLTLASTGSRLGPTGSFLLGPTGDNRLGGGGEASLRYLYTDGGGSARGRTVRHSIRHNIAGEQPTINTFSSHYQLRDPR